MSFVLFGSYSMSVECVAPERIVWPTSWGEIFELFMGPKSWVELIPYRPGQLGTVWGGSGENLIRLNSSEFKNLASGVQRGQPNQTHPVDPSQ